MIYDARRKCIVNDDGSLIEPIFKERHNLYRHQKIWYSASIRDWTNSEYSKWLRKELSKDKTKAIIDNSHRWIK